MDMDAIVDDPDYFARLERLHDRHWWSKNMGVLLERWLDRLARHRDACDGGRPLHVLDVGCGSGRFLVAARRSYPGAVVVGVEPSRHALRISGREEDVYLMRGAAQRLPLPDACFDAVTCLDVFQHLPNDDTLTALGEIGRVLLPGGSVFLRTNGAGLGVRVGSAFTRDRLETHLKQEGFLIERISRVNSLPSLVHDLRGRIIVEAGRNPEDVGGGMPSRNPSPLVSTCLEAYGRCEATLVADLGVPLPFGHSLIAVARKPAGRGRESMR